MARPASPPSDLLARGLERWLVALAGVAACSILPPYLGPLVGLELDVSASLEIIDHVVPAVLATAAALFALRAARRGRADSTGALIAIAVCALAGLFETVTHVPLVLDPAGAPVGAVVLHSSPGPGLLLLALVLLLRPLPADAR